MSATPATTRKVIMASPIFAEPMNTERHIAKTMAEAWQNGSEMKTTPIPEVGTKLSIMDSERATKQR